MIEDMAQVHMSEAELARDLHAVLEKVRQGTEVIIERDAKPVAVIKAPQFRGRPIDECIALVKTHGSHATLDEDFPKDLEEIINSHREPLNPPAWD
jgi:antitoxin (DNA-binding transcriptional repressor) of toxin-antitoxin stability system